MSSAIKKDGNGPKKGLFRLMSSFIPSKHVEISSPNEPVNITAISESSTTDLIDLSEEWQERLRQSGISRSEQEKNPQAVMGIIKFDQGGRYRHENVWDKMAREDDNSAPNSTTVVTQPQRASPRHQRVPPTPPSNAINRSMPQRPKMASIALNSAAQPRPRPDLPAPTATQQASNALDSSFQWPKMAPTPPTAVTQAQPQLHPDRPAPTPAQPVSIALDCSMSQTLSKSPAAEAEIEGSNSMEERIPQKWQQGLQRQSQSSVQQRQDEEEGKSSPESSSPDLPLENSDAVTKEWEWEGDHHVSLKNPVALAIEKESERHREKEREAEHDQQHEQASPGERVIDPRDLVATLTVLNDRGAKKKFLAICQSDPKPVANLIQTLLDQDNLASESRPRLVRTLAQLAKSSASYPDCLNLTMIQRTGTDPVAGGGFADVWKGYFVAKPVALKALRIYKQSLREKAHKEFSHEAVIWRQLRHPNILPFYGVFTGNEQFDRLCLVSPWMDAGNAIDYLNVHPDSDRLSLLSDVAQGIKYLHLFEPPIIHGDLKGANIFVLPSLTACIGDFGLARFRESQESTLATTTGNTTGTLRWQAPELLKILDEGESTRRTEHCDIYSFGCVCLELMTGNPPFSEIRNDGAVMMAIAKGQIPQRPMGDVFERGLDDALWDLMRQCWDFDPALRPRIGQVAEYFQQHHGAARPGTVTIRQGDPMSSGQHGLPDRFVADFSNLLTQLEGNEPFG